MRALILAAGRGTRMKELTADRPKPMVLLRDRPILEHIVTNLAWAVDVSHFIIVTGYRGGMIESHFGDAHRLDMHIQYIRQKRRNGNAKAIHLAREAMGNKPFFLTFGDIIVDPSNYARLAETFRIMQPDLLMSLIWLKDVSRHSSVVVDRKGRVLDIEEKPDPATAKSHWNSAGVFIATPALFEYTARLKPSVRGEYELTDAIRAMIQDPARVVRAEKIKGYWGDLADAEALARMEKRLGREPEPSFMDVLRRRHPGLF